MIIVDYAMTILDYVIPYCFHDYSHGWMLAISEDDTCMVIKFYNIKIE
jgi:hypothetical protein